MDVISHFKPTKLDQVRYFSIKKWADGRFCVKYTGFEISVFIPYNDVHLDLVMDFPPNVTRCVLSCRSTSDQINQSTFAIRKAMEAGVQSLIGDVIECDAVSIPIESDKDLRTLLSEIDRIVLMSPWEIIEHELYYNNYSFEPVRQDPVLFASMSESDVNNKLFQEWLEKVIHDDKPLNTAPYWYATVCIEYAKTLI